MECPQSRGTISTSVQLPEVEQQVGSFLDVDTLPTFVSSESVSLQCSGCFTIHNSSCSCQQYYPVLSFFNGRLHVNYVQIHVTKLAELSCGQVRKNVVNRGDDKKWVGFYDGFYLTQGHYSMLQLLLQELTGRRKVQGTIGKAK